MKLLYSLLLAVALTGCLSNRPAVSPPKPAPVPVRAVVTGEIVSYRTLEEELKPLMDATYDPQLVLMDRKYGAIPEDAMRRIIAEAFTSFDFDYVSESNDCDDGALLLVVQLRHLFRRDTAFVPLAAPIGLIGGALVGDIPELKFVSPGVPLYHAVVLVRCQGGKYLLIEPASKQICEFTSLVYEGSFDFFLGVF